MTSRTPGGRSIHRATRTRGEQCHLTEFFYFTTLRYVVLCYAMLCHVALCCAMLRYVVLCCAMLCHVVLCCAMLCHVVLCCAMLCCVVLRYVVLCCVKPQPNDRVISTQHIATMFGLPLATQLGTCCDMLSVVSSNLKMIKCFIQHLWMLYVVVVWPGS